ncbi:helix-turn-helix domain-containing protein [Paenibacillus enshidis]|uniref:Helix-turn-helix domain-containing protein n=1 Tax=Paenibacillus enshidis TaxID=1458439 RepID=A0ABV5B0D7_9BACL
MARRTPLGWTQRKLAEQTGTTQARISQIEAGFEGKIKASEISSRSALHLSAIYFCFEIKQLDFQLSAAHSILL